MLCATQNSPVSRLTEKGISRIGSPLDDINTAIENAGRLEVYKLEKNVSIIGDYCRCRADDRFFRNCYWNGPRLSPAGHEQRTSRNGESGRRNLYRYDYHGSRLDSWIIAYMGYNHIVVKTDKIVHQMEATAVDFLDILTNLLSEFTRKK